MALGFGLLRLAPSQFWAMTPIELAVAIKPLFPAGGEPLGRADFDRLMQQFPDGGSYG
ncbi:phage tail assembly chaperone [Tianweitania sp. BSSL-BM11]|uniref:Phage tail assembly chaperone n=2 Tax=Tianweitania aestuarii TaxID=2814886 RepID=A0ABS5RSA1_9HYPH|nr:phage tail assembly chaperone [Tianweitania aestuarii]